MAGLSNAPEQFVRIWRQVDVNHRIAIVLAGLGSVAAVVGLVVWSGRPSYGLLFGDLSRKDAGAIVAQLDSEGIAHKLGDGGTAVLVEADKVQTTRAKLMSQGLPSGGDGFEILDKGSLGMTHFAERKTYLRAVQGELARTLEAVDAIEWARVHISAPEPSVFLDREQPASASVLLKTRGGAALEGGQIASITSFVARAVEGLEPKNVTLTDQFLNPLSKAVHGDGPGAATAHLQAQRDIEQHLANKVRSLLDATLGPGKSSVSVRAEIELKQEELRSTEYDNEGRVAKTEKTMTKKRSGGTSGSGGGPVGAEAALRNSAAGSGGAGSGTDSTTEETFDYEVPVKELRTVNHGVDVKRLSVGVLVAGTYKEEQGEDGKASRTFVPLPEAEITKLTEVVKSAVGFSEARKDSVTVDCRPFNTPEPAVSPAELASARHWALLERVGKHAAAAVVVLAWLLVMRSMAKKARAAKEAAAAEAKVAAQAAAAPAASGGGASPLRERVAAAIHGDPERASTVLKTWHTSAKAS